MTMTSASRRLRKRVHLFSIFQYFLSYFLPQEVSPRPSVPEARTGESKKVQASPAAQPRSPRAAKPRDGCPKPLTRGEWPPAPQTTPHHSSAGDGIPGKGQTTPFTFSLYSLYYQHPLSQPYFYHFDEKSFQMAHSPPEGPGFFAEIFRCAGAPSSEMRSMARNREDRLRGCLSFIRSCVFFRNGYRPLRITAQAIFFPALPAGCE